MAREQSTKPPSRRQSRLDLARTVSAAASQHFATRFHRTDLREEICAETQLRVLVLIEEQREPLDREPRSDEACRRITNFIYGISANVAREFIRRDIRHGRLGTMGERAAIALNLEVSEPDLAKRVELQDAVSSALSNFNNLSTELRETLVAEEIRRNDYQTTMIQSLCTTCSVDAERVQDMISQRERGDISAEAWRQRVHRFRERAREALGGSELIGALMMLVLAAAVALGTVRAVGSPSLDRPSHAEQESVSPLLAKSDGSTQNGRRVASIDVRDSRVSSWMTRSAVLASTQNGSPKKPKKK